jgi:PhnB protein
MATVNIYLNFNGNCREAFDFYKSVLGGEYSYITSFADMPPQEGMPPLSDAEKERIMHVSLPISKETVLMGSDTIPSFGGAVTPGDNFSISLTPDSRDEADRLFAALSEGGKVTMPLEDQFWDSYFGALTDRFGINWMVNL